MGQGNEPPKPPPPTKGSARSVKDPVEILAGEREAVLAIDVAGHAAFIFGPDQHRILASIEADLALVMSRAVLTGERVIGINIGTRPDLCKDVKGAFADLLLDVFVFRQRIAELLLQIEQGVRHG